MTIKFTTKHIAKLYSNKNTYKHFFFIVILLITCFSISKAQTKYNIYEINKGEILKTDYQYIEYLFDNYLSVCPLKDNTTTYPNENINGIINFNENIIQKYQYKYISSIKDDYNVYNEKKTLLSISNGKEIGLFTLKNNTLYPITDFKYLQFGPFLFNSSCLLAYDGYCQIINLQNKNIIKTEFVEIKPLTNNLIATKNMNYKWGILDKNGTVIQKNIYDKIGIISDSLISITKGDSIGVLNNQGKIILAPAFKRIETGENLIITQKIDNQHLYKTTNNLTDSITQEDLIDSLEEPSIQSTEKYGAFDLNGNIKIPFNYTLLQKGNGSEIIANKDGKFGIISNKDSILTDFKYDEISTIFDIFYLTKNNKKFGIIKDNKILLDEKYEKIFPISNNEILYMINNIWYRISYNQNYTIIKTQKTELNPNYQLTYLETYSPKQNKYFNNTNFFAIKCNNKYGIINKNLDLIIPIVNEEEPRYFNFKYFDLGKIYTLNGTELIDIDVSRNYYDDNLSFTNTIICKKEGKYGVINSYGKTIIPFKYSYIQNIDGTKFIVKK